MKSIIRKQNARTNTTLILIVSIVLLMLTNTQLIACSITCNNWTSNDTLNPTERYVLINKLILSERYYRDLSDIHEQKIVMLKKDIELYSKQINKYEQNEKEFRAKVKLLEYDKQNLQSSNNKLTKQKKRQRDVLLVTTGVAIIEGLLLVLLVN
jgi:hypothetical protein